MSFLQKFFEKRSNDDDFDVTLTSSDYLIDEYNKVTVCINGVVRRGEAEESFSFLLTQQKLLDTKPVVFVSTYSRINEPSDDVITIRHHLGKLIDVSPCLDGVDIFHLLIKGILAGLLNIHRKRSEKSFMRFFNFFSNRAHTETRSYHGQFFDQFRNFVSEHFSV